MAARGTVVRDPTPGVRLRARGRLRERAWKIPVAALVLGVLFALATAGSTTTGATDGRGAVEVLVATPVLALIGEAASLAYYAVDRRRRTR